MQDCYAFDVGDFGKLGLLRHIHRVTNLRLGVQWWRTTLGTTGSDGKHVAYLHKPAFRACDPDLWEEMRRRFNPNARTIAALHPLLPAGTLFHDTPVPARARRSRWLDEAVSSVQASAVVFCDPDNGLTFDEPCRSLRHIGVEEIRSLYSRGQSLVVYHTPDRSAPHAEHIASVLERLRQALPDLGSSWAARFHRGSSRVFFVLAQRPHVAAIDGAMVQMRSAAWVHGGHFEVVPGAAKGRSPRSTPLYDRIARLATQQASIDAGLPPKLLGVRSAGHRLDSSPVPSASQPETSTRPSHIVRVILNDNGGLNVAANPWLTELECPCHLTSQYLTFCVEAPFSGRTDMYRISPSALTLAKGLSFAGDHLSNRNRVDFTATVVVSECQRSRRNIAERRIRRESRTCTCHRHGPDPVPPADGRDEFSQQVLVTNHQGHSSVEVRA